MDRTKDLLDLPPCSSRTIAISKEGKAGDYQRNGYTNPYIEPVKYTHTKKNIFIHIYIYLYKTQIKFKQENQTNLYQISP